MSYELLIIEDNNLKYSNTLEYLPSDKISVVRCTSVAQATRMIKLNQYDGIIIDMQLPDHHGDRINIRGGIDILNLLRVLEIETPRCVNTSSEETIDLLEMNGYADVQCIINSSMYDCTTEFDLFIENVDKYKDEQYAKYQKLKEVLPVNNTMLEALVVEKEQLKDL